MFGKLLFSGFLFFTLAVINVNAQAYKSLQTFSTVLNQVSNNYLDEKKPEELVYYAIQGVLKSLDPHSVYLPPNQLAKYTRITAGELMGFGLSLARIEGDFVVLRVFEESPASKAGIHSGDILRKVDSTVIKDTLSITEVFLMLYGEEGSTSELTFFRPNTGKQIIKVLTRDKYVNSAISHAMMLSGGTFYIRLTEFDINAAEDFYKYISRLNEDITKKIVIDLRDNPGGLMHTCENAADIFLDKGDTIYTSSGRKKEMESVGVSEHKPKTDLPIIVLVNRNSASASEMFAGSLQDNNRALVIGTNTFGKGLIQVPFPLDNGGGLVMTVGRYVTPSGRIIQKDYKHSTLKEYYDIVNKVDSTNFKSGKVYRAKHGRKIYGGGGGELEEVGGIFPDIFVENDKISDVEIYEDSLNTYAINFIKQYFSKYAGSKEKFDKLSTFRDEFFITETLYNEIMSDLTVNDPQREILPYNKALSVYLKAEMAKQIWDDEAALLVRRVYDNQLNYALKMTPDEINQILGR